MSEPSLVPRLGAHFRKGAYQFLKDMERPVFQLLRLLLLCLLCIQNCNGKMQG